MEINPNINNILIIIVVITVFVIAAFSLGNQLAPAESTTHTISGDDEQAVLEYLDQTGDRVAAAFPETTWQRGESGTFLLAVSNQNLDRVSVYYLNVYLEGLVGVSGTVAELSDDVDSWLSFSNIVDVNPGGKTTTSIIVTPSINAPFGAYILRAAICQSPDDADCHHTSPEVSPSIYGSAQLSFEIEA